MKLFFFFFFQIARFSLTSHLLLLPPPFSFSFFAKCCRHSTAQLSAFLIHVYSTVCTVCLPVSLSWYLQAFLYRLYRFLFSTTCFFLLCSLSRFFFFPLGYPSVKLMNLRKRTRHIVLYSGMNISFVQSST